MTEMDLQRSPFSREPDSLFYYHFDSIEQRLNILDGLVKGADLFVLVIGDPGAGKTTMMNRYLASIESEWTSARIQVDRDPGKSGTVSLEHLARRGYPVYVLHDSADPIVIIDDAHQLSEEELKFLIQEARVPGSQNEIKRLVLFGELELHNAVTNLAATLSADSPVSKIYLPGLTGRQTTDYLRHRLEIAGYEGEFPFDADTVKSIHQNAGGYPGPINDFAHQWLVDKYSSKQEGQIKMKKISSGSRQTFIWTCAGAIILLLAALWFFSDRKSSTFSAGDRKPVKTVFRKKIPEVSKNLDKLVAQKGKVMPPPVAAPQPAKTDQLQKAQTPQTKPVETANPNAYLQTQPEPVESAKLGASLQTQPKPAQKPKLPSTAPPIGITKSNASETSGDTESPAHSKKEQPPKMTLPTSVPAIEVAKANASKTSGDTEGPAHSKKEQPPKMTLPTSVPAIEVEKSNSRKTSPDPVSTAQPKKEQPPERVQQPLAKLPQPKPLPVMAKAKAREIHREDWLLSQDGESYTIQIIGVSNEATLLDFVERNQLLKQNEIAYYKSTFQGRPWYQALYGIYPSGREARLAAEKLPENIRQAGPWIRKLSGVQKAIRK